MSLARTGLALVMTVLLAGAAPGQSIPAAAGGAATRPGSDEEIALQRALDQPLTLNLQKVDLAEAFRQIAATAKIPLHVDPACYDLLPYGATTRVSVDFKQSNLREALDEVLIPLGLREKVSGSQVMIVPSEALLHIGRRADWEELKLLKDLWTSTDVKPGRGAFNLSDAIRAAMEGRKDLLMTMTTETGLSSPVHERALEQIVRQLPMSAYRALDMYCQLTGEVWFVEAGPMAGGPTGGMIRVMTRKKWILRQLERPVQLKRVNEPLQVIVADLAHVSGIRFVPEAGLYQAWPAVTLRADNGTVLQTLDALATVTPIIYEVRDDSVLLRMAAGAAGTGGGGGGAGGGARGETIIGRISVPVGPNGMMMDVFIRESDLSAELNELRKKHIESAVEGLRKTWAATQPGDR